MSQLNEFSGQPDLFLNAGDLSNTDDLPVFHEGGNVIITTQPQAGQEFLGPRRPIPVSTLDWRSTNLTQFTPITGLDFLIGVEAVTIQQTVELHDMLANVESENRYTVKVPQGETLYYASEVSSNAQRMFFGSSRSFTLNLYDQTRQEAIRFARRLAGSNCLMGCRLQELEVHLPSGDYIGTIRQQWSLIAPSFLVTNEFGTTMFKIEGPAMCSCATYKDAAFNVFSPDGLMQLCSIRHQWDQLMVGYNLSVYFPSRSTKSSEKALLLGAAFLLEYVYFERAKSKRTCSCLC